MSEGIYIGLMVVICAWGLGLSFGSARPTTTGRIIEEIGLVRALREILDERR